METTTNNNNSVNEKCVICLEKTDFEHIFTVTKCGHSYCFSCMKNHVRVKLLNGGTVPKCPHQECNSELSIDSWSKFLSSELIEMMRERIKEASIPVTERFYCPYPHCSALIAKNEIVVAEFDSKCLECDGLFCVDCKVPWHNDMTCDVYKGLNNPNPDPSDDVKLKCLADTKQWRQCVKCGHMIELAQGCFHITCRCGFEFCYNCGAEFRDKKATCSCPLWMRLIYGMNKI